MEQTNFNLLLKQLKQRMFDMNLQTWNQSLEENNLCQNYKLIKESFQLEPYIKSNLAPLYKCNLAKFRCGSHNLPVNSCRYTYQNPTCQLCSTGVEGNEFHYLMNCKFFERERKTYIKRAHYIRPTVNKYKVLMNSQDAHERKNLAKFIGIILYYFKNL